jgi:hypothetical protein
MFIPFPPFIKIPYFTAAAYAISGFAPLPFGK